MNWVTNSWNYAKLNIKYSLFAKQNCPLEKKKITFLWVHIPSSSAPAGGASREGSPGVTSDPTSPRVGRVGGWRYRRWWWDQSGIFLPTPRALLQKKERKKKVALLRTCPFVLSNQWGLWSLYGPDSVFSGLIYWSSVPGAHGSANKSRANTDHLGMSCGKAFAEDIRCLLPI